MSTLGGGGSEGMLPQEILKFSFSKMHILRIPRDNLQKQEPKLTVKITCVYGRKLIFISVE